jgi:hypothetical protein
MLIQRKGSFSENDPAKLFDALLEMIHGRAFIHPDDSIVITPNGKIFTLTSQDKSDNETLQQISDEAGVRILVIQIKHDDLDETMEEAGENLISVMQGFTLMQWENNFIAQFMDEEATRFVKRDGKWQYKKQVSLNSETYKGRHMIAQATTGIVCRYLSESKDKLKQKGAK